MRILHDLVVTIENGLRTFGRRNLPLRMFLGKIHTGGDAKLDGMLPLYLVKEGTTQHWLYTAEELESYRQANAPAPSTTEPEGESGTGGPEAEPTEAENVTELHEVRNLNKALARLRDEFGMRADVLLPAEVTGDEPPPRFILSRDGEDHPIYDLRELVTKVRSLGEKGIKLTRFKGLGEMDADQLWDTTMDPTRRTLLQVKLEDVAGANDLFTTLMGEDVEPRREFIEKHALEVKNLDV